MPEEKYNKFVHLNSITAQELHTGIQILKDAALTIRKDDFTANIFEDGYAQDREDLRAVLDNAGGILYRMLELKEDVDAGLYDEDGHRKPEQTAADTLNEIYKKNNISKKAE